MSLAMFRREAVALARGAGRRTSMFAVVGAGLLSLGLCWGFLQTADLPSNASGRFGEPAAGPRRIADLAMNFAGVVQFAELWLCALLAPGAFAGMFAADRARGRLDLLLTTHVSRAEILLGKYFARLAWAALLLALPLPTLVWFAQFGGPGPATIAERYALTLLTLAFAGALGACLGARCRTPLAAALLAYLVLGAAWVVAPIAAVVFHQYQARTAAFRPALVPAGYSLYLEAAPPARAFYFPTEHQRENQAWLASWDFSASALKLGLAGAALLLVAPAGLRPSAERRRRRWPWRSWPTRWAGIVPVRDPFWLRARRAPVHDRSRALAWANLLCIGLFVFGQIAGSIGLAYLLAFAGFGVAGLAVAFGVQSDKQNGFFEQALLTALTPWEIHRGYVRALAEHLRVPILLTLWPCVAPWDYPLHAALGIMERAACWWAGLHLAVALALWSRSAGEAWALTMLTALACIGGANAVSGTRSSLWQWPRADVAEILAAVRIGIAVAMAAGLAVRRWRGVAPAIVATMLSPAVVFGLAWMSWDRLPVPPKAGDCWHWLWWAATFESDGAGTLRPAPALSAAGWIWALHWGALIALGWLAKIQFARSFEGVFRARDSAGSGR